MRSIAIIGSTGTLGSTLNKYLNLNGFLTQEVNSTGRSITAQKALKHNVTSDSIGKLENIITECDYVINCVGIVKQKIREDEIDSMLNVIKLNSIFSLELTLLCEKLKTPLIQIGTDCVFSGNKGNYNEFSIHDPVDLYGYSKTLGESKNDFLLTLRCSFIGKELASKNGLMEWVLNQEKNAIINGFKNHFWNGLTTLHVSKLISGIIKNNNFQSGTFHIVPYDKTSKLDLIRAIAKIFERSDLIIEPTNSKTSVDRTLSTIKPDFNEKVWLDAGYNRPPSINEMLKEYFNWVSPNPRISNYE